MAPRQLRAQDYTIGWICALPIELTAAAVMLDEPHQNLSSDNNDPNLYTLGRIGSHNVVIVCLPTGLIGTNPSAAVSAWMQAKFPSIRVGLMIGIGGGVPSPSENDIRLGDVVISQPHAGHGGVVQYDFGKAGPDGTLMLTGFLNAPPLVLLNAISKLRSNLHIHPNLLSAHLSDFQGMEVFARPAAGEDILYEPTYGHVGGPTCDHCSKEKTINRAPRASEDIVIHYGTIASGNQVIKDAITRDGLSLKLGGVLCFEMEAAGLMNNFPCLVIRGICDYADTHKNKKWQPFAAAVAAACGKEVLSLIPAFQVPQVGEMDGAIGHKKERPEPSSRPRDFINNYGSGTQNINSGSGTMNNNTGSGKQYIGQNQYFRDD